ncbi:MBL fold metallo-hydrolase [Photobacterium sp. DNB23_23_1]
MEDKDLNTSRRDFIKSASAGVAALSLAGTGLMGMSAPALAGGSKEQDALFEMNANEEFEGLRAVTVGNAGPPMANGNTTWASTLIQFDDKCFLVDCGAAATHGLLLAGIQPGKVTNMLFSHHHADHNSDYFTYAIGGWAGPEGRRHSNVVGPKNTKKLHNVMLDFYKEDIEYRTNYGWSGDGLVDKVNIMELEGGETFELDGVKISTTLGVHTMTNIVYRFDYNGQSAVVTGDSAYTENIVEISKGVDILVIDTHMAEGTFATNTLSRAQNRENMRKAHMSNEDIALIAAKAKPKKLVLTHLPPGYIDIDATIKAVRSEGYEGEVVVSEPCGKYVA